MHHLYRRSAIKFALAFSAALILSAATSMATSAPITYRFDYEITTSRYFGSDPDIALLLPTQGSSVTGQFTYDPTTAPSTPPGGLPGTYYLHVPAGINGLQFSFPNGVTWSTSPDGTYTAWVINRDPGSGADTMRFFSKADSLLPIPGLVTDTIFVQFGKLSGDLLVDETLPPQIFLEDWPATTNIDLRATDSTNSEFRIFGKITNLELVTTTNLAPIADAGEDRAIRAGDFIVLDGSGSFDDNTNPANLGYSWSISQRPASSTAELNNAQTATPSFTADIGGVYVVELKVTDDAGQTSPPDQVTISSDNLAPTAVAGDDQLVLVDTIVSLNASGSFDAEGDVLSYEWSLVTPPGSAAYLLTPNAAETAFVADSEGVYVATLTAQDFIGPGVPDSVQITATSAAEFAEQKIVCSADIISGLTPNQTTTKGNQNALLNFLRQAVTLIQHGQVADAIEKLNNAIDRTNGCDLGNSPDGNGPGRDWVTDCSVQPPILACLRDARNALTP